MERPPTRHRSVGCSRVQARVLSVLTALFFALTLGGAGCDSLPDIRRGDPEPSVQRLWRAGQSSDPRLSAPLLRFPERWIGGERSPGLRGRAVAAVLALGERKDERAIPALLQLCKDSDEIMRLHAVEALGLIGSPSVRMALVDRRAHDPSARVRARASAGIRAMTP